MDEIKKKSKKIKDHLKNREPQLKEKINKKTTLNFNGLNLNFKRRRQKRWGGEKNLITLKLPRIALYMLPHQLGHHLILKKT